MRAREFMNIAENAQKIAKVWHLTSQANLPAILRVGLDPTKTWEGEPAVYVWASWGHVLRAAKEWTSDGESDVDVILELNVPASWLTDGDAEIEPDEFLIFQHVPPTMIRVVVPSITEWDGSSPYTQ